VLLFILLDMIVQRKPHGPAVALTGAEFVLSPLESDAATTYQ
jgi:hypothetical protein